MRQYLPAHLPCLSSNLLLASFPKSAIFNRKFFKTQARIFGHYKPFLKTWLASLAIRIFISHFQRIHRMCWSSHRCRHRWFSWLGDWGSWKHFSWFWSGFLIKAGRSYRYGGTQGAQKVGKNQNAIQADLTSFAQLPEVLEHFRCFWQGAIGKIVVQDLYVGSINTFGKGFQNREYSVFLC